MTEIGSQLQKLTEIMRNNPEAARAWYQCFAMLCYSATKESEALKERVAKKHHDRIAFEAGNGAAKDIMKSLFGVEIK